MCEKKSKRRREEKRTFARVEYSTLIFMLLWGFDGVMAVEAGLTECQ